MQVYYFTRTKRSEKIAFDIANSLNTQAFEIHENKDWSGAINFLKAGASACKKELSNIEYEKPCGKIILVFPVWAGNFPPAIRTFIENYDREKIIAIPTSLGTGLKENYGFSKLINLIGKDISIDKIDLENL